jgi:hypothetical protein
LGDVHVSNWAEMLAYAREVSSSVSIIIDDVVMEELLGVVVVIVMVETCA